LKSVASITAETIFTRDLVDNNRAASSRRRNILSSSSSLAKKVLSTVMPTTSGLIASLKYFGEGQVGDMQLTGGNKAVAEHSASGESLLLFRKASTGLRFEGEMVCETFHYEQSPDREGNDRKAIVFELRPLEAVSEIVDAQGVHAKADLANLLAKALSAAAAQPKTGTGAIRTVYERSRDVRDYVLARAGNDCEGCQSPAPFTRKDGSPYLEPHHIRRLSDGGPDHPAFVIALCPNCHRRVHAGADGETYNTALLVRMAHIEPNS
jgi:5-methylcytosine-specific restriction protein A